MNGFEEFEQRLVPSTLLSETFEGSFPSANGWSVGDANTSGTAAYWDDVNFSFGGEGTHGGSWKGYCAGFGHAGTTSNPKYRDYMNASMSRSINLAGLTSASLSFWYKIPSIESGNYDHLRVYIGSTKVFDQSSPVTSWTQQTISLTPYLGSNRTLKFEFYSDVSGTAEGAYLDDILVVGNNNPANDNFVNRTSITGSTATGTGTNVGATKETGEANHAGNSGGKSVWWTWTAPSSGRVQIDTIGSNFDTLLGVYTGTSVSNLTRIAGDDDGGGNLTSKVTFNAVRGTTYQIAVDGYNGASGNITLHVNLVAAPGNDDFVNRTRISGSSANLTGTNVGATKEYREPNHAGNSGGTSVWWTWTAPSSGSVTIDTTGSNFNTLLAVYTGSSVSSLTAVTGGSNNDDPSGGTTSKVSFNAVAGRAYQIAVDGYNGASGTITLHLYLAVQPDFTLSAYRLNNPFWRAGFAPKSTNPPNPQLGNALGNCTWYANGRLRELGYSSADLDKLVGNASTWDNSARANGIPVSSIPGVGAIAQTDSGGGGQGHVAVVERVNTDGTIVISESSYAGNNPLPNDPWNFLWRTRTVSASTFQNYIYVRRT